MDTRSHGNWGHGLRPGTTTDIGCAACRREDSAITAEQIARKSCANVFAALSRNADVATIEDDFNRGVMIGIGMAAVGESPFTMEIFADGSWTALGIVAGYEAFLEETDQYLGRAA